MPEICFSVGERHNQWERRWCKIKVYGFKQDEQGIMEVENSLKAEQKFVGGRITTYPVTDDLILICNDDGIVDGLKERVVVLGNGTGETIDQRGIRQIIHGNCFICRFDGCDGFESIKDSDVETIKHHVKKVAKICDSVIEIEK